MSAYGRRAEEHVLEVRIIFLYVYLPFVFLFFLACTINRWKFTNGVCWIELYFGNRQLSAERAFADQQREVKSFLMAA